VTRFKEYINEKITKSEFNEVLKNKDIWAGCEFEFYMNDMPRGNSERYQYLSDLQQEAFTEIESCDEWYNLMDDIDMIPRRREEVSELISDGEKKIDEIDGVIKGKVKQIKSLKFDLNGLLKDEKTIKIIKKEIDNIINEISVLEKKKKGIIDDVQKLEFEKEKIDNGTAYHELIKNSELSWKSFPKYYELMHELDGTSKSRFEVYIEDWIANRRIDPPDFSLDDDEQDNEIDYHIFDGTGFPINFEKSKGWDVRPDGSLGENGVEVVTPIMKLPELIDSIEKVFKWIDKYGYTDNTCGFHVHMSINNYKELDELKLILFAEEGLIYKVFPDRIGNDYTASIKKGHIDKMTPFTPENIKELMGKQNKRLNIEKYLGIHLIDLENNHVEFRYMGGKNYHKKFDDVRNIIANYAHWMSIAGDPDYKRKEYITKLAKLADYFNYIYLNELIERFKFYTTLDDLQSIHISKGISIKDLVKIKDKLLKPYITKLKSLKKPSNIPSNVSNPIRRTVETNATDMLMKLRDEIQNNIKKAIS